MKLLGIAIFFILITLLAFHFTSFEKQHQHPTKKDQVSAIKAKRDYYHNIELPGGMLYFDLLDPETAPPELVEKVMIGYRVFNETKKYVPSYVGDRISCNNCHFSGGNTLGGKNNGISLLGVTGVYPKYSKRNGKTITLKERIDNCFLRSLNGRPLPDECVELDGLIAYLSWISMVVEHVPDKPWLGLKFLESKHTPDVAQGKKVYEEHCSICHEPDGRGTATIPPLWGDGSFNDGAGMCNVIVLSAFVWYNMPFGEPNLTQEQALDVAAYVIDQPRPEFDDGT